ncbi:MAG TPA: phosphoglycerate mutase family protein [Longimicrobiaceae bacterium]|nr:phosphoglycerate mutase family protein [Longimicrobiaceae bacterium]
MRSLRVLLIGTAAVLAALPVRPADAQAPTVVVVVRHAEKVSADPSDRDPALTPVGEARARDLAAALASAGVDAILTTEFRRTQLTARPLADALGLTPEVVRAASANHPASVAEAVRRHAGHTVVVVGHSNTVPAIIAALGGPRLADICDSEHANLFVLVLNGTSAELIQSRYGAADPAPGPECQRPMRP